MKIFVGGGCGKGGASSPDFSCVSTVLKSPFTWYFHRAGFSAEKLGAERLTKPMRADVRRADLSMILAFIAVSLVGRNKCASREARVGHREMYSHSYMLKMAWGRLHSDPSNSQQRVSLAISPPSSCVQIEPELFFQVVLNPVHRALPLGDTPLARPHALGPARSLAMIFIHSVSGLYGNRLGGAPMSLRPARPGLIIAHHAEAL